MEITEKLHTTSREQWRDWLADNHSTKREIWISTTKSPDGLQYLDAVEEALCFGWIDSTIKAGEGVMWRNAFHPAVRIATGQNSTNNAVPTWSNAD